MEGWCLIIDWLEKILDDSLIVDWDGEKRVCIRISRVGIGICLEDIMDP
jgi:hypothetical protein